VMEGHSLLMEACVDGDIDEIKYLLEGDCGINLVDKYKRTALHYAFAEMNYHRGEKTFIIVKMLCEKEGIMVDEMDINGLTPFHLAIRNGDLRIVKYLARKGARIWAFNVFNRNSLDIAIHFERKEIMEWLLRNGLKVNRCSLIDASMCVEAVAISMSSILMFHGSDVNMGDDYGHTPLLESIMNGRHKLMKHYLGNGADPNLPNSTGVTPVLLAVIEHDLGALKILVEAGADVKKADNNGHSPLHDACESGDKEIVSFLVDKGANVNAVDKYGRTPLHCSVLGREGMQLETRGYELIGPSVNPALKRLEMDEKLNMD